MRAHAPPPRDHVLAEVEDGGLDDRSALLLQNDLRKFLQERVRDRHLHEELQDEAGGQGLAFGGSGCHVHRHQIRRDPSSETRCTL